MKKIAEKIAWIMTIVGAILLLVSINYIDNNIIFLVGLILLIVGIISILIFGGKTREWLFHFLDFL